MLRSYDPALVAASAAAATTPRPAQARLDVATPTLGVGGTVAGFVMLALLIAATTAGRWARGARAPRAGGAPGADGPPGGSEPGLSLRAKLAAASGAAGLVLVVGLLAYGGAWQYRRAADLVEHSTAVRAALARVPTFMAEAESGARGFVITGTEMFAADYRHAADSARAAVADARRLTADNAAQQRRLAVLVPVLGQRLAVLDSHIRERHTQGLAAVAQRMTAGRGGVLADSVRALVAATDAVEARRLDARSALVARRGRVLDAVLLGGSLVAFALISLITQAIRRDVGLREAAQRRVEAQAAQLEQQQVRLEEQLAEEQVLAEELTEANTQLTAAQAAGAAALAEARREEARYRALVEAGAQIVWGTAPDGGFAGEQPAWAAFTGQAWAAYQGWGWLDAVHPDDRDVTAAAWEMALAGGDRYALEHRLRRHDGVYRRMSARAVPVRDGATGDGSGPGAIREWVGVHTDVTAERRVQAQREALIRALERSNRDLDQFAYVASHDLKAPLRGISNLASWIEEDLAAVMTPEAREQMALLRGRVHRMEALIDGVLQYSRAGRVKAAPERVDTGALAREVVELLAPRPEARVEMAPDLPVVTAERVPLQQVLLNLVGNALKHAGRPDAVVRVAWATAAGPDGAPDGAPDARAPHDAHAPAWYCFSVADNGPGIAPSYHERVFGIFQTLQSRDRVEGTGIGLSVVKKIVEGQGGRVWLESAEGAGATFCFTWPATPPEAAADTGG